MLLIVCILHLIAASHQLWAAMSHSQHAFMAFAFAASICLLVFIAIGIVRERRWAHIALVALICFEFLGYGLGAVLFVAYFAFTGST